MVFSLVTILLEWKDRHRRFVYIVTTIGARWRHHRYSFVFSVRNYYFQFFNGLYAYLTRIGRWGIF